MVTRRQFIATTAAGAASLALPAYAMRRARRVNDEVRIAIIGLNSRGRDHISAFSKIPGVRIVALCDADSEVLAREAKRLAERGVEADTYADMRRIMDRTDIDAVSTATPNHWHALVGIWACQSGKDAYIEKPVSHNVWEGRQLVNAARKYNRIVQAGTQARSSGAIAEAIAWMREGHIGRIVVARGLCYKPRRSIGKVDADQPVPAHVDYSLWTGPAELKPLRRKKLHYDWHWDFNTGNGDLGNQGIHQMDVCRWALGESGLARGVASLGGRFGYEDDGNTPNTQLVWLDYPTAPLIFEVRGLPRDAAARAGKWEESMDAYKGVSIGSIIECEGGRLVVTMDYDRAKAFDKDGKLIKEWRSTSNHFANFIDGVRSRKASDLAAEIELGHVSSALCHIGNISYQLGSMTNTPGAESMPSDGAMADTLNRLGAHLAANGVDVEKTPMRVGPRLEFDPASERFIGNEAANQLLRRASRAEFAVPEAV